MYLSEKSSTGAAEGSEKWYGKIIRNVGCAYIMRVCLKCVEIQCRLNFDTQVAIYTLISPL